MKNNDLDQPQVQNIVHFKAMYKALVHDLVQVRTAAGLTQQFMAEWLCVDRRKIIAFENLKKVDLQILLKYADKLSVDIKINYTIN